MATLDWDVRLYDGSLVWRGPLTFPEVAEIMATFHCVVNRGHQTIVLTK